MRFKVDENLPIEVAEALRQAGHDAATVLEQRYGGSADAQLATLYPLFLGAPSYTDYRQPR